MDGDLSYELPADAPDALGRLVAAAEDGRTVYLLRAGQRVAAVVPAWLAEAADHLEDEADARAGEVAHADWEADGRRTVPAAEVHADLDRDAG